MKYTKYQIELLDYLKSKFIRAKNNTSSKYAFLGDKNSKYNIYYVSHYNENLVSKFPDDILLKFEKGSGGELDRSNYDKTPPKMAAIRSSSALFYNIFESLDYSQFSWYGHQITGYTVEEQLKALTAKANLDGYLESKEAIIFIESKFAESYFGKGGTLSSSYIEKSTNINFEWQEFFKQFLIQNEFGETIVFESGPDKTGKIRLYCKSIFLRYDGLQMLKHLLGIYKDIKTNKKRYARIKEVYLVNLVWSVNGLNEELDNINNEVRKDLIMTDILGKMERFMQKEISKLGLNINFKIDYVSYNDFLLDHKSEFKQENYSYLKKRYVSK